VADSEAATDLYVVTCGRSSVGLEFSVSPSTDDNYSSLMAQAIKGHSTSIYTTELQQYTDDDEDEDEDEDDDRRSYKRKSAQTHIKPPVILEKGSGSYLLLVSKGSSSEKGKEFYYSNVLCYNKNKIPTSTKVVIKQDN
jgi:hypothetical protein